MKFVGPFMSGIAGCHCRVLLIFDSHGDRQEKASKTHDQDGIAFFFSKN